MIFPDQAKDGRNPEAPMSDTTIDVSITIDDIENGKMSYTACPIALAICRCFDADPDDRLISVGFDLVCIDGRFTEGGGSEDQHAPLPADIQQWQSDFDMGKAVKPINFELPFDYKAKNR